MPIHRITSRAACSHRGLFQKILTVLFVCGLATTPAQLYTRSWNTSVVRPVRELRDFERVSLEPGENRNVSLRVPSEQLKYFGVELRNRPIDRKNPRAARPANPSRPQ